MSFFLTALLVAVVVGILRGLSLGADRPKPRARVAAPAPRCRPATAVRESCAA